MSSEENVKKVRVQDKRRHASPGAEGPGDAPEPDAPAPVVEGEVIEQGGAEEAEIARLREENEQLRYHVADLENRRKRMMRDHSAAIERATKQLITKLLPVLDNLDRAIEHAEDPSGLDIVSKDLRRVLGEEGLEEIPAKGRPFDYNVHEAIASHDDPSVDTEIVTDVFLKGYKLKDVVLRPAQVVVARPMSIEDDSGERAEG